MVRNLIALALAAVLAPAFAQPIAVDSGSQAGAIAGVGDINVNMPAGSPLQGVVYSGGYKVDGVPVATAGQAFATQPAWKCTGAGTAAALQLEKFGITWSGGADDKNVCGLEFRMMVVALLVEQKTKQPSVYAVNHAIACNDETLADALERTKDMQCAEPMTASDRKARWARERQAREAQQRADAILNGQPEPVAVEPRQPKPWEARG